MFNFCVYLFLMMNNKRGFKDLESFDVNPFLDTLEKKLEVRVKDVK